jgi:ribosomal protein S18 acetylase RimI-like enzyme
MGEIEIIKADLNNKQHQDAVVAMMDAYSSDPMGDAKPLSEFARRNLIRGLQEHPTSLVFLTFQNSEPCGIATCFRGFSTFAAMPLINIHDLYIDPRMRSRGIGRMLLDTIEKEAKLTGCCKLTLEVQQSNSRARQVYSNFGFAQAVYAADAIGGGALYMTKAIPREA